MSRTSIDAGQLIQGLQVLALQEGRPGVWAWEPVAKTKGQVTWSDRRNLFSSVGIGARGAEALLRRQPLTLHNALLWTDFLSGERRHLFLTAIVPEGRLHLRASAAVVTVDTVKLLEKEGTAVMTFPGVLTEKYARHSQEWPMSVNELGLVLVVPKPIALSPGSLVEARGAAWEVLAPHELDPFKNEYEIGRRADL